MLTRTSSKGYSYPVNKAQNDQINGKKKKREKVLTHEDGKRVRYFDDDDKYSLKSMASVYNFFIYLCLDFNLMYVSFSLKKK